MILTKQREAGGGAREEGIEKEIERDKGVEEMYDDCPLKMMEASQF